MSTFMANKANIERKWYILDAAGKPLGKTAVRAADLLRGKLKVTYTPHADCGDNVIIINAGKAVLTGKKPVQKIYRTHSGWVGGLKETPYRILMQEQPELAMKVMPAQSTMSGRGSTSSISRSRSCTRPLTRWWSMSPDRATVSMRLWVV